MPDLTEAELDVLARYFGMGKGSDITSHPPHETIGRSKDAFDRLFELKLLISEPINDHGVIRITCTDEAADLGRERMKVRMRAVLSDEAR
jgi:hypothetical protein